ncbi:MAG: hypothetical protein ABR980_04720 [Ignavibacteriaceae bacterium]
MKTSKIINRVLLIPIIFMLALLFGSTDCKKMTVDQRQKIKTKSDSVKNEIDQKHNIQTNRDSIKKEIEYVLNRELELFYPLCLDTTYGGYNNDINYKWQLVTTKLSAILPRWN